MKNLYILCGCPGSTKSTWAKKFFNSMPSGTTQWISRDQLRFAIVSPSEDYFSKEDEVFKTFIKAIQVSIDYPYLENIIVDATHLTEKARNKVLDKLILKDINIIPVNFLTPLKKCLENNNKRIGRENIPEEVIKKMYNQFRPATNNEKYKYFNIININ